MQGGARGADHAPRLAAATSQALASSVAALQVRQASSEQRTASAQVPQPSSEHEPTHSSAPPPRVPQAPAVPSAADLAGCGVARRMPAPTPVLVDSPGSLSGTLRSTISGLLQDPVPEALRASDESNILHEAASRAAADRAQAAGEAHGSLAHPQDSSSLTLAPVPEQHTTESEADASVTQARSRLLVHRGFSVIAWGFTTACVPSKAGYSCPVVRQSMQGSATLSCFLMQQVQDIHRRFALVPSRFISNAALCRARFCLSQGSLHHHHPGDAWAAAHMLRYLGVSCMPTRCSSRLRLQAAAQAAAHQALAGRAHTALGRRRRARRPQLRAAMSLLQAGECPRVMRGQPTRLCAPRQHGAALLPRSACTLIRWHASLLLSIRILMVQAPWCTSQKMPQSRPACCTRACSLCKTCMQLRGRLRSTRPPDWLQQTSARPAPDRPGPSTMRALSPEPGSHLTALKLLSWLACPLHRSVQRFGSRKSRSRCTTRRIRLCAPMRQTSPRVRSCTRCQTWRCHSTCGTRSAPQATSRHAAAVRSVVPAAVHPSTRSLDTAAALAAMQPGSFNDGLASRLSACTAIELCPNIRQFSGSTCLGEAGGCTLGFQKF